MSMLSTDAWVLHRGESAGIPGKPIDICELRGEAKVVIGNAGVVEVVGVGASVSGVRQGDRGIWFCNGIPDEYGYPMKIFGYDCPGTIGVLAKTTKLNQHQFVLIPEGSQHLLEQWAAFSLRFVTAWANWNIAWNGRGVSIFIDNIGPIIAARSKRWFAKA